MDLGLPLAVATLWSEFFRTGFEAGFDFHQLHLLSDEYYFEIMSK
jgi:hypothetical protein